MDSSLLLLIGFILIFVLAVLKVPIWLALLGSAIFIQHFVNHMSLNGILVTLTENLNRTSLMCIPFFLLVGTIVQETTMGKRLLNFAIVLVQRIRGGLAIACVVANGLFGAISGSSGAATAFFGKLVHKPLKDSYNAEISLGIITSSSTLSGILPPSITLVMYAITSQTSVAKVFLSGVIPAIVIIIAVCFYLLIKLSRMQKKGLYSPSQMRLIGDVDIKELTIIRAGIDAIPVFVLPVIVFAGIYSGVFTTTEAAAISALYCLICGIFLRDITLRNIFKIFKTSIKSVIAILVLFSAASAFAQAITIAQFPQLVSNLMSGFNRVQFLMFLNIMLLIVGLFIDCTPCILIFTPIVMPTALALGIDPVHLGLIFVVNLSIGLFSPPLGLHLFVCQGATGEDFLLIAKSVLPYMVIYFCLCLLFTYVPWFAMFMPNLI